jgi:serine phosphatase RsbU (regulator of sigma subunit)
LSDLRWIHRPPDWLVYTFPGPFPFNLADLADFVFLPAMMAVLLLRFNRASTHGERLAAEMEAARAVQQVLVPEKIAQVEGYAVESAYRPASQVSGDFFQVLPLGLGGTLLALGDVSGKGLKAAMTGTLAIGAMRTLAAEGLGPAALLAKLNEQIVASQQGGFITLICAVLEPDGTVTIANGGHLNPYQNGEEIAVESGLPLGVMTGGTYAETKLTLTDGGSLTFLSDGVVEARSVSGELFGFERTREISGRSPAAIAEAAQEFGQDDDITVLSVKRVEKKGTEIRPVPCDLAVVRA